MLSTFIKLRATSLRDFCIILSGDLLFWEFNSMIRCLNIYLPLEQMAFNTSATECHSWQHRALLMSWATQMFFFPNLLLIYFGVFMFLFRLWVEKTRESQQHTWQDFFPAMVKIIILSNKRMLCPGYFSFSWILGLVLHQLDPLPFKVNAFS